MPQPTSTRLHPIAAIRAMRNLTRDREDMRQGFLLMDALRGKTTLRLLILPPLRGVLSGTEVSSSA